ncbi:MAG: hypothetical protein MO853_10180 [Candidatus Protistobacter heckmanni]|nr:hypothetical protein [Candidatus Protistobacter heckmanni]
MLPDTVAVPIEAPLRSTVSVSPAAKFDTLPLNVGVVLAVVLPKATVVPLPWMSVIVADGVVMSTVIDACAALALPALPAASVCFTLMFA